MPEYLKAATETYKRIYGGTLQNYHTYWQLGHVFDTLVDYWGVAIYPPAPRDDVGVFIKKFLVRGAFPWDKDSVARNPWWFDDYCWWSIASTRAGWSERFFKDQSELFTGIASLSWEPAYRIAPNVWENADQETFADYAPLFDGGVWNWIYCADQIHDVPFTPSKPGDYSHSSLFPIQNTVTNALYWVAAAKLFNATKDEHFKQAAIREFRFLESWFENGSGEQRLLHYLSPETAALVRERVGFYKNGNEVRGYDPDLFWAGDQGLILGGLVEHMKMLGSDDPDYPRLLGLARAIIYGVATGMRGDDGRMLPWIPYTDSPDHGAPGGDVDDYSTGIAVFMRYLLAAWLENPALRKEIQSSPEIRGMIRDTAEYFVKNPAEKRCTGKDCKLLLFQVNDLATFLTAYMVLEATES